MAGPPDVDRIVFETPTVRVGAFRCAPSHPSFADSGPIRDHCFVFPRTAVVIQHTDGRPFTADPTVVTLYNRGQEYRRRLISPDGDRCDWYAVSPDIVREAVADYDPAASNDERRPIRFTFARTEAETYWLQRRLFSGITRSAAVDAWAVEESVFELLDRVFAAAYGRRRPQSPASKRTNRDVVHATTTLLGRRFADALTLTSIARDVGTSVFHLCRRFKRATGLTLHEYRDQLRLRTALERLETGNGSLTDVALDLGYSSHSHFTANFRRAFGAMPSQARRAVRAKS